MYRVYLKTYGCQMNERDSEAVTAQLGARGFVLVPAEAEADVVLLNTCSVRDAAEVKAIGKMQNLAARKRRTGRPSVLGFLGCLAQARGESLFDLIPEVNLVLGTQKFHHAAEHLAVLESDPDQRICDTGLEEGSEAAVREHDWSGAVRPVTGYVSIMQGCNQHCTFCIVPATRGTERSRAIADIVAECQDLAAQGVKEITLLGQIVTSYGKRLERVRDGRSPFVQLVEAVHAIDGIERLRFTAAHPKGYGDDLIDAFGSLPKLCESAHLPVQSGSDRVLRLMHRGYTVGHFRELIDKLRQVQPALGLTTDLLVGFPGETEADFEQTLALARAVEFDNAYLFKYSPRQGTPAADLPGRLPPAELEARHAELLRVVNAIAARRYAAWVGKSMPVLVEGPSRRNAARLEGRTRCNKIVVFDGPADYAGRVMDVQIQRAGSFTLYGEIAKPTACPGVGPADAAPRREPGTNHGQIEA